MDGIDITILLDRSGSMYGQVNQTIRGFNKFLDEQIKVDGLAALSLYQFDDEFEKVYSEQPIQNATRLSITNFCPRGQTALYDAIGKAVHETDERLSKLPERPSKVGFVIITDGFENASEEYDLKGVQALIQNFKEKWQFVYLGADDLAIGTAIELGIPSHAALSWDGIEDAFKLLSKSIKRYRLEEGAGTTKQYFLPSDSEGIK